jgi:hypothetical protein
MNLPENAPKPLVHLQDDLLTEWGDKLLALMDARADGDVLDQTRFLAEAVAAEQAYGSVKEMNALDDQLNPEGDK